MRDVLAWSDCDGVAKGTLFAEIFPLSGAQDAPISGVDGAFYPVEDARYRVRCVRPQNPPISGDQLVWSEAGITLEVEAVLHRGFERTLAMTCRTRLP